MWQVRVRRAGAADRGLSVPALNLKVNSARSARYGFTVCEPSTDYTPTDPGPRTRIRRRSNKNVSNIALHANRGQQGWTRVSRQHVQRHRPQVCSATAGSPA